MRALLIAAVVSVMMPAGANAATRLYIPPGNSGADEYVESVPTAGGSTAIGRVVHSPGSGSALAPATQTALIRMGADGRAAEVLADATAPTRLRHGHRVHVARSSGGGGTPGGSGGGGTSGGPFGGGASTTGGAPAASVLRSLFGLQGQGGAVLPALLIATMLALGAGHVWRHRDRA